MARCVEKIGHKCSETHTSSDSLQVWYNEDTLKYSGFCFSCGTHVKDPYGNNPPAITDFNEKTPEERLEEMRVIRNCPIFDQTYRKIPTSIFDYFKVRMAVSEMDGKTPHAICFPYTANNGKKLQAYKHRLLNKKMMWAYGDMKKTDPFGWPQAKKAGGKTLYITEGELDAMSLLHIFQEMSKGGQYAGSDYAIISIPNGSKGAREDLAPYIKEIEKRWKEVVLVFDMDEAGQNAVKEVRKVLPKALSATLPCKDVNECLKEGRLKSAWSAVMFNATAPQPTGTKGFDDLISDALLPVEYGVSYPWNDLTELTYGIRKKEVVAWGGGTGCGKTLTAYELMPHLALQHGWKGLGVFLEASGREVLQNICGKRDGITYHVPNTKFDPETLKGTATELSPFITLWDNEESGDPYENWEGIKNLVRQMSGRLDYVILDNITAMSEGLNSSERNDFIGTMAKEAVDMAMKHDIHILFYSHLNAPDRSARSHENGAKVHESQFTGSRALQRYCHMMFGFSRNKQAVDNSCSYISVLKNRKYGRTGMVKTYYYEDTGKLLQFNWADEKYQDKKIKGQ